MTNRWEQEKSRRRGGEEEKCFDKVGPCVIFGAKCAGIHGNLGRGKLQAPSHSR